MKPSAYPACSENQTVLQRVDRDVIDGIAVPFQALHRKSSRDDAHAQHVNCMSILLPDYTARVSDKEQPETEHA